MSHRRHATFPGSARVLARPATGTPFVPTDIANLFLWFDASQIEGLVDTNAVATWPDETAGGHDATQATAANQPVYRTGILNGKPVVRFATNDFMQTAAWVAEDQPNTIIAIGSISGNSTHLYDGLALANRHFIVRSGAGLWSFGTSAAISGGAVDASHHVFTARFFGGTDSVLRVDGAQVAAGNVGAHTLTGLTLGASFTPGAFLNGDIAEVLLYTRSLTLQEIIRIELYASLKYGISSA